MNPLASTMRRLSQRSQNRKSLPPQSPTSYNNNPNTGGSGPSGPGGSATPPARNSRDQPLGGEYTMLPNRGGQNEGRPISSATDGSFDFANRPVSGATGGVGGPVAMNTQVPQQTSVRGLSRTDQIVLKHFWESKYQENTARDLHYLRFPQFPQPPRHRDLLPYCEIYHLVKTSPGATIISLGSANGVYIGFELQTGSQLHIDLDDDWFSNTSTTSITHHRVSFRPFSAILADPSSGNLFRSWPKPLTIEFLEEQYQAWTRDLMSPCWESSEVRELGTGANTSTAPPNGGGGIGHAPTSTTSGAVGGSGGSVHESARGGGGSVADDGYVSERSTGRGI